ncbi:hypothetical protein [Streptomyces sp. NRRL S-495]|uniref:hypothetical protein n=1 Tax=Streptomyces sp. NRRL S-495 TaxID=1609133 RepID=UPI00133147BB|nr:hypothetical protein [Streptomyces sp. NRRL S-495]
MSDDGGIPSTADTDVDLPATLRIAGLALERTESPASLACWTGCFPESAGGNAAVVSLVIEPAAPPEEVALQLVLDVVSNFDVFVDRAVRYCRTRLRERHFELTPEELSWLDLPELPLAGPEVVVWADRTWAIRFTESRFRLADPFGILVTFNGTQPVDVQGPKDEQ